MERRKGRWGSIATMSVALQLLVAATALAHHPTITASSVCSNGVAVVNYTSAAWVTDPAGENPRVDILFNNVVVGSGAYALPTNSFSGSAPAPAGSQVVVTALVVGTWGDGAAPGQSESVTVPIATDCQAAALGRFTGGGSQIRVGGVRVTRGLTIHCDLLLSNNLEINWQGNQFHMTEHLTTVACTDDPNIIQAPPVAPLDTLVGVGTGRYNGTDGYTVRFTLVDYGEPGSDDRMAIQVFETANPANVVLNVPLQVLTGGNLQAHYDQPHK